MVFLAQLENLRSARLREGNSRRVCEVRHQVQELDLALLSLERLDRGLERLGNHAVVVGQNMFHVSFVVPEDSQRTNVRRPFG